MPPVLYIAFLKLATRTEQNLFTQEMGLGMDQRHHVLQLVAEPKGAPRLIVAASRPEAAA